MRQVYVWDRDLGQNVPREQFEANKHNQRMPQYLAAPRIISDGMDAVQSQLDGKLYDSKSTLRKTYKAAGMTEVGNDSSIMDPKPFKKPRADRQKILDTVGKIAAQVNLTTIG